MFTLDDLRTMLSAQPFVPFRLRLADGGHVDVPRRELVVPGRRFAVIGLLDPKAPDKAFDRFVTGLYLHVTRHEMLSAGAPPFSPPSGSSEAPSPTPA